MKLIQYHVQRYKPDSGINSQSEYSTSVLKFSNPYGKQPLNFIISTGDSTIARNISLSIDNHENTNLISVLKEGQVLKYTGDGNVKLYDSRWHELKLIPVDSTSLYISKGDHSIKFISEGSNNGKSPPNIELRTSNSGELIQPGNIEK